MKINQKYEKYGKIQNSTIKCCGYKKVIGEQLKIPKAENKDNNKIQFVAKMRARGVFISLFMFNGKEINWFSR